LVEILDFQISLSGLWLSNGHSEMYS